MEREGRAFVETARGLDHTLVELEDSFRDGEPEAASGLLLRAVLRHAMKPLEDMRQLVGGDAAAAIVDGHAHAAFFAA